MYTSGSAYLSFDDDKMGAIEEGKYADLAVLSDDPLCADEQTFRRITSSLTLGRRQNRQPKRAVRQPQDQPVMSGRARKARSMFSRSQRQVIEA